MDNFDIAVSFQTKCERSLSRVEISAAQLHQLAPLVVFREYAGLRGV
jgi:hypothetical protein